MSTLVIIALILGTLVVLRVMNVARMASSLAGEREEAENEGTSYLNSFGLLIFMIVGLALTVYMIFKYQPFMLPESASAHGVQVDFLLNMNFVIIGIVFFVTQILLFWFAYRYRHSTNRRAYFYPENHKLEIIWTVIPTIVLAVIIATGLNEWNKITMSHPKDGMRVQVYGYQFAWIARYAGPDNQLGRSYYKLITPDNPLGLDFSDPATADDRVTAGNEMRLPKGKGIQFEFNARDVLHSAYFPHFRTQMNCVPGMTTGFYMEPTITTTEMREITKNEKFDYILLCNKICGVAHYSMKMKVVIDEQADFEAWLSQQKPAVPAPTATAATASL